MKTTKTACAISICGDNLLRGAGFFLGKREKQYSELIDLAYDAAKQ